MALFQPRTPFITSSCPCLHLLGAKTSLTLIPPRNCFVPFVSAEKTKVATGIEPVASISRLATRHTTTTLGHGYWLCQGPSSCHSARTELSRINLYPMSLLLQKTSLGILSQLKPHSLRTALTQFNVLWIRHTPPPSGLLTCALSVGESTVNKSQPRYRSSISWSHRAMTILRCVLRAPSPTRRPLE